jgi:hypothetical protein
LRYVIENLHRKQASLIDAIAAVRLSLLQMQGTIARSKGKPFLASLDGVTIAAAGEPPSRLWQQRRRRNGRHNQGEETGADSYKGKHLHEQSAS